MAVFENTVLFTPHSQTIWNKEKRTQGHFDSALTDFGVSETKQKAQTLREKGLTFDLIICSHLGRAKKTAVLFAQELGAGETKEIKELAERNLGVFQGKTEQEIKDSFPQFFDKKGNFIPQSAVPRAETYEAFLNRVKSAVAEIAKLADTKNILVITHGGVIEVLKKELNLSDYIFMID